MIYKASIIENGVVTENEELSTLINSPARNFFLGYVVYYQGQRLTLVELVDTLDSGIDLVFEKK